MSVLSLSATTHRLDFFTASVCLHIGLASAPAVKAIRKERTTCRLLNRTAVVFLDEDRLRVIIVVHPRYQVTTWAAKTENSLHHRPRLGEPSRDSRHIVLLLGRRKFRKDTLFRGVGKNLASSDSQSRDA